MGGGEGDAVGEAPPIHLLDAKKYSLLNWKKTISAQSLSHTTCVLCTTFGVKKAKKHQQKIIQKSLFFPPSPCTPLRVPPSVKS